MWPLIRKALGLNNRKPARAKPLGGRWRNRALLRLEELDNRVTPAAYTVNTLFDTPDNNLMDGVAQDANGWTSLRAAIEQGNNQADAAVTITFNMQQGQNKIINLTSAFPDLDKNFTIVGLGAANLTVQRDPNAAQFRIFKINADTTSSIAGLTLANGDSGGGLFGGAVFNLGNLTLTNCVLAFNRASAGGGAWNAGTLIVSGCSVHSNEAQIGGGGLGSQDGELVLFNSSVSGNGSESKGGGIYIESGMLQISDSSTIDSNWAPEGGGIFIEDCEQFTMTGGSIIGNYTTGAGSGRGGGIYFANGSNMSLTDVSITSNHATKGGGMYIEAGLVTCHNCTISGNSATVLGAGIALTSFDLFIDDNCTIPDSIDQDQ